MSDVMPPDGQEQIKKFLPHFVPITWIAEPLTAEASQRCKGPVAPFASSGFIISVDGQWVWLTAGHVITRHQQLQNEGFRIHRARLFDKCHAGGLLGEDDGLPIEIKLGRWFTVDDEDAGLDYGGLLLEPLEVLDLQTQGIIPLDERYWGQMPPRPFDGYCILGIPDETQSHSIEKIGNIVRVSGAIRPGIAPVDVMPLDGHNYSKAHPRFIGKLRDDLVADDGHSRPVKHLHGMSGGPIFGHFVDDKGVTRYRVVAIQSGCFEDSRVVTGCFVWYIAQVVRDFLRTQAA